MKTSLVLFEVKAFFDVNSGREEQPPDGRETGTPLLRGGVRTAGEPPPELMDRSLWESKYFLLWVSTEAKGSL